MKATAVALLIVSVYWIGQGMATIRQDITKGVLLLVLGVLLLPLAKYLWDKNLGGAGPANRPRSGPP
jgi:hypothetical protein